MTTINVAGLCVEQGGAQLLDFDLRVAAGESVAVVGEDQRRLTMLIRCCGGLLHPTAGTVEVAGVDIGRATRRTLLDLRLRVGYVSVHGGLLANMTLRDNVELPMRYHQVADRTTVTARAQRLLDEAGLGALATTRTSTVSAEIQKCVAYLRAVAIEPEVLLVEDPSAMLHPLGRRVVQQLHQRLRERGVTVLVTDDDEPFAAGLSDRQITLEGPPSA